MKRIYTSATVLFVGTAYAGQIKGIKEAENVAILQMKAYLSVDMEKVAGLTHPETINAFYIPSPRN